jgi:hypothetical protein
MHNLRGPRADNERPTGALTFTVNGTSLSVCEERLSGHAEGDSRMLGITCARVVTYDDILKPRSCSEDGS